jgi:hypothetical protein
MCVGNSDPNAIAVYTDYEKTVAIKGAKQDTSVMGANGAQFTAALSGKWEYRYYWQVGCVYNFVLYM